MINFQELEKVAEFKNGELNWLEGRDINAVYVILVGDEYYIGSSHYTYLRIGQHLDRLLKGEHHSCKLQEKFNAVGEFYVYSLDRGIEKSKLQIVEAKYIQQYKPTLNIALVKEKEGLSKVREIIKEKGMTTQEVADQMGISLSSLNQSISGNPTIKFLRRIAEVVGCQLGEFFSDEMKEENPNTVACPKCGHEFAVEIKAKEE